MTLNRLVVGLTGGIGCGKSMVTKLFTTLGVHCIDMDQIARDLVTPGKPAYDEIISVFGPEIVSAEGSIDRKKLANIIFNDPLKRSLLEQILHPKIRQCVIELLAKITHGIIIIEIPLLNSRKQFDYIDRILVVDCTPETQIDRIQQREQMNKSLIGAIMRSQLDRESRLRLADDVIENNSSLEAVEAQVLRLYQSYQELLQPQ